MWITISVRCFLLYTMIDDRFAKKPNSAQRRDFFVFDLNVLFLGGVFRSFKTKYRWLVKCLCTIASPEAWVAMIQRATSLVSKIDITERGTVCFRTFPYRRLCTFSTSTGLIPTMKSPTNAGVLRHLLSGAWTAIQDRCKSNSHDYLRTSNPSHRGRCRLCQRHN